MIQCKYCRAKFKPVHKRNTICPDPECKNAAQRERYRTWVDNHPDGPKEASRLRRERYGESVWPAKQALGIAVTELKATTPCMDCGGTFPAECMDFDHRPDETKSHCVGTMVAHGHNAEATWAEIAKCDLICANCHRIRTRHRRLARKS
jgi:hypothetical protein